MENLEAVKIFMKNVTENDVYPKIADFSGKWWTKLAKNSNL